MIAWQLKGGGSVKKAQEEFIRRQMKVIDRTQMLSYLELKKEGMRDIKKEEKQVKTSFGCICAVTVS